MVEEVDPATIRKTQEILGGVIRRPPLAEKNLKRPPFRFLHDIFTNVIKVTGFMKGLYTSEEMVSDNIKDKESKITFLQKAIDLLAIVTDQPVNVKPSKIVAGHEAQKTNEFLQILGIAAKSKIDTQEAVLTVLGKSSSTNQKGRRASVDKKSSQKNASEKSHSRSTTKTIEPAKKGASQVSSNKDATKSKDSEKTRSRSKDSKSREKDKPKDKSRTKRDDSKSRSGTKTETKKDKVSKRSKEEKDNDIVPNESPIKRPSTLQNGLMKASLEDEDDIDDATPILPVNNITDDVSHAVNGDLIANDIDSPGKEHQNQGNNAEQDMMKDEDLTRQSHSGHISRPPSTRSKRTKSGIDKEPKVNGIVEVSNTELHPRVMDLRKQDGMISPVPRPPSARPSSSRPAPPRIRIRHIVENEEPSARPETAKPVENVIIDDKHLSDEDDEDEIYVVAEDKGEIQLEEPPLQPAILQETPDEDKGSLVRQLLATKKDLEGGSQHPSIKVEIDKSQLALNKIRESANKELEQLRSYIQNVSKTAYPLGRMLDYLQEDVDSMRTELKMWREEHKHNLMALRKEKSITESALEPLRIQLDDLDQLVQDQLDANGALKSTILRNEEKIQRMLGSIQRKS